MSQKLGNITQSDVYLNEVDVAGRLEELDLGSIEHTEVEHSSLGMIGVLALPGRPVKAIKGKLKFKWLDEVLQRQLLNPTKVVKIQLHTYVDVFDEDGLNTDQSHTLVTHLKFMVLKSGGSSAKNGDQMGGEFDVSITSFVQKVYGQETAIIEFDAFNRIYNINGEPVWPS